MKKNLKIKLLSLFATTGMAFLSAQALADGPFFCHITADGQIVCEVVERPKEEK